DQRNNCIRLVNTSGSISTFAGNGVPGFYGDGGPATAAELIFPAAVAIDSAGNVFISDAANSRIRRVTVSDTINTSVGTNFSGYSGDGGPPRAAEINNPLGILFDATGNLIFADAGNSRVRKITPAISTGLKATSFSTANVDVYPIPNTGCFTISGIL